MDIDQLRAYCHQKKGVTEDFPFDEYTLCIRVMRKIFVITGLDSERFTANLKCDPDYAVELREQYEEIQPGWHMNKSHWNTIDFEGNLPHSLLCKLIDHSYDQVVKSLKKSEREALAALPE